MRRPRRLRIGGAAGIGFAAIALVLASSVNAYTIAQRSGRPGKVTAQKLVGYNYFGDVPYVAWPGGKVYRSPAAPKRLQVICVRYVILDWNYSYGNWFVSDMAPRGRHHCFDVSKGRHLNMPSIQRSNVTVFSRPRSVWRISWWANAPYYRKIGSEVIDFRNEGDYWCATGGCDVHYDGPADRYYLYFPDS
jgi:hypothetical protein